MPSLLKPGSELWLDGGHNPAVTVPIPGAHEAPHAPETLAETAREVGLRAESAPDVATALKRTDAYEPGAKRILICGSLYLAGHVLGLQEGVEPQAN
jgi:dihydrofolate synthase/folylpolyglutamate synthase